MTDPDPPRTPAGWYPEGTNGVRYWDGSAWTDQRAPAVPQRVVVVPPKRIRNYAGDISLVLAIAAWIIQITKVLGPAPILILNIAAIAVGVAALANARGTKRRATAIVGVVLAGLLVGYYLVGLLAYLATS